MAAGADFGQVDFDPHLENNFTAKSAKKSEENAKIFILQKSQGVFVELRIDNQLNEKTEILIRNIIGAAIEVHRELGPGFLGLDLVFLERVTSKLWRLS